MEASWLFTILFLTIGTSLTSCEHCTKDSHVVTTYSDLLSTSGVTELQSSARNYSAMLFKDDMLYVGAKSQVLQIDKQSFTVKRVLNWSSDASDTSSCIQIISNKEECFNFIQVLQPFRGKLLVCGTNSYRPLCNWHNLTDLSTVTGRDDQGNYFQQDIDGVGLVPYSPKFYSTGILSEQGRYYAGTMLDARSPTIYSMNFKPRPRVLETARKDKNWLSGSEFVKSFNIDKYIYFFFREDAIENDYSKTLVSTVARICKGDYGGSRYFLKKNFVTFNKARLDCKTSGTYPTEFTSIQDVFWDEKSSVFSAVFTMQPNGVGASAICTYKLQDVERVFNGDYKYYDKSSKQWVRRTNNHHFENCTVKSSSQMQISDAAKKRYVPDGMMATGIMTSTAYKDSMNYQLMDEKIQPQTATTQYIKLGKRFKNIAVDFVNKKMVTYVSTDEGSILKLSDANNETCIVEEIRLFDDDQNQQINHMHLDSQKGYLYVTTPSKVLKVQLNRCYRHKNKQSCLDAGDPYCGWSLGKCKSWQNRSLTWDQDLTRCPVLKAIWSPWSSWQVCKQQNGNVCQCRKRKCLNTCNPRDCLGKAIDLKQCTVNKLKVWTSEADWLLDGVINGNWNTWSTWSTCSVSVGTGIKKRSRSCNNPAPSNGGVSCIGERIGYDKCNVILPLKELKKQVWTELSGVLGRKNRALRTMYTCSVRGHDLTNMTLDVTKTETVNCRKDPKRCKVVPTKPPGQWNKWAKWSKCVFVGMQYRTRKCKDGDSPCIGDGREDRHCYPTTTPTTSTTTQTTKTRHTTLPTEPDIDSSWGTWSSCLCDLPFKIVPENDDPNPVGIQHRTRRCRGLHPNDGRCPKDRVEYKTCECEKIDTDFKYNKMDDAETPAKRSGYRIGDVIGAAIVTGVLVLVICAVMAYILVRRRQNFEVSKIYEKSMREDPDESKYERTNGVDYPSETSKDRNSSAKLQPVVETKSRKTFKDLFKKNQNPDSV